MQYFWLVLLIIFVVVECLTVGLVSIWFAGGALAAMLISMANVETIWQVITFLVVSALLLLLTRPIAVKYFNSRKEKTNYQSIIGMVAKVTEKIDNFNQTGAAFVDGQEWTARAVEDASTIEKGAFVTVVAIEGVKIIVEPFTEAEQDCGNH